MSYPKFKNYNGENVDNSLGVYLNLLDTDSFESEKYYNDCVFHMDNEIREKLHREITPCSLAKFLRLYCHEHFRKYAEKFYWDKN
jgi:hypothetical protein